MKTTISLVLFFFLTLGATISLKAAKPNPKKATESTTQKTIRHYFKFPSVLSQPTENKEEVTTVEVLYTTDASGKVTFVIAKTEDKALKAEVEKQFYNLTFNDAPAEVVQKMVLNFKFI